MHKTNTNNNGEDASVLATLRRLIPERTIEFTEALRVAELQANRLVELAGDDAAPLDQQIARLPRLHISYRRMPTSGISYWNGRQWMICLNADEPETRQRFTVLHEYKHIVDHGYAANLYRGDDRHAEQVADYFAGCALMPKRLMKRAWGNGVQRIRDLAQTFDVSERAVEVRLAQLGLSETRLRCAPPGQSTSPSHSGRYYRQALMSHAPAPTVTRAAA